jgi:hypothetical protein
LFNSKAMLTTHRCHGEQGCQIFLGTIYQSGEKYTKMAIKLPKVHKIYLMIIKYSKWADYITTFSIPRSSKIYPNWDFWSEKKSSGNTDVEVHICM